jgi:hypothetical protein
MLDYSREFVALFGERGEAFRRALPRASARKPSNDIINCIGHFPSFRLFWGALPSVNSWPLQQG